MAKEKEFLGGVPDGYDLFVLAQKAHTLKSVLYLAASEQELIVAEQLLGQIDPNIKVLTFPAWDTIPYDRVSPHADIESRRVSTLSELSARKESSKPLIVMTTVPAIMQKVPPASFFEGQMLHLEKGQSFSLTDLNDFFQKNGYRRTDQVSVSGEYALRGGIVDVFPAGQSSPVRLDFFGDDLEDFRLFDVQTQKTVQNIDFVDFRPISEFRLTPESIALFRSQYLKSFGSPENDLVYESSQKVAARIISRNPNGACDVFLVDKGEEDGIEVNMNVIADGGLVGIVTETGKNWSKIRTIIADESNVSGRFQITSDTCVVCGNLENMDSGYIDVEMINLNAEVYDNYEVVTSYISDKYLPGILIGYVYNVATDPSELNKRARLIPVVDFEHLEIVLIIKAQREKLEGIEE